MNNVEDKGSYSRLWLHLKTKLKLDMRGRSKKFAAEFFKHRKGDTDTQQQHRSEVSCTKSHKKIFSANSRDLIIVRSSYVKLCCATCKHPQCHENEWHDQAANECQILNETRKRCWDDRNHVEAGVRTKSYEEFDCSKVGETLQRQVRELRTYPISNRTQPILIFWC